MDYAHQAPLLLGFSKQEYPSGLPFPSLGDLPKPEMEPVSLMFPALEGTFSTTTTTWEASDFSFNFSFYIGDIQMINNVVIVSGGQKRYSAIHIHVSILP